MFLSREKVTWLKRTQNGRKYLPVIYISEGGLICQIYKKLEKVPKGKIINFPRWKNKKINDAIN